MIFLFLEGLIPKLLFSPCPWLSPSQGRFHSDGRKPLPRSEQGPGEQLSPKLLQTWRAEEGFCKVPNYLAGFICF